MSYHDHLSLFPLRAVLFPYVSIPLHIFEERYRLMISRCIERNEPLGIILADEASQSSDGGDSVTVYTTGTLARIEQCNVLIDGRYDIVVRGESRFHVSELFREESYLTAKVRPLWDLTEDPLEVQPIFDMASELFREYVLRLYSRATSANLKIPEDPVFLSYAISAVMEIDLSEKQQLLATNSPKLRLQQSVELLKRELLIADASSVQSSEGDSEAEETGRTISRLDSSYRHKYFSRS